MAPAFLAISVEWLPIQDFSTSNASRRRVVWLPEMRRMAPAIPSDGSR